MDAARVLGAPSSSGHRGPSLPPSGDRALTLLGWSQLGWLLVALVGWCTLQMTFSADADYTSGELLDHLMSWRETGILYPALGSLPPLRVLNYPPLVLVLARALAGLGLPALAAGRLVNDLAALLLLGGVAWWAYGRGARGAALAGTVGLLGASFPFLYASGQLHIELWAVAGIVWGFALLDFGTRDVEAVLAGAALAFACFAKQTEVVPALVALAWAWMYSSRRSAAVATGTFVGVGVAGCAAITAAWGIQPWLHMLVFTVGTFSVANLGLQMLSHAAPWALLLGAAGALAWRRESIMRGEGALWYWLVAVLWSLSSVRVGSSFAYFLDLHAATVVWLGPRLFDGTAFRGATMRWLLAAQVIGADVGAGAALAVDIARLAEQQRELPALCARIAAIPAGELITEEAGIARACGRPALFHPFILTSLAQQHRWSDRAFVLSLTSGQYEAALLPFDPRTPPTTGAHAERWSPVELAAFASAPSITPVPTGRWLVQWR